ncbi:MAG: FAD-binding oxidoreductase [Myxococcales bacterium]
MAPVSRAGVAADAVLGLTPGVVYTPSTQAEALEVMRLCASGRRAVAFAGGRTEMGLGTPPHRVDALIETRRLDRILEYASADMVLIAEAGTPLATVQATAGKEGQRLSLDPPLPGRATVGGIVAANSFGPRRARYGSVRDVIIGVSIVRADGAPARGGGKVVKNVAGFDLPKLACGSLGTLGMIATVSFRLHPLPETEATLLVRGRSATQVVALLAEVVKAQLEPSSAAALCEAGFGPFDLALRFEGFAAGVSQQAQRFASLGTAAGAGAELLDEAASRSTWERHDRARTQGDLRVKLSAPVAALARVQAAALEPIARALKGPRIAWYPTLGLGFLSGDTGDAAAAAAALQSARAALAALGGSLTILDAPPAVRAAVDVWGPPPPAFALMQRLKDRFDPEQRLNPGRFVGGL